MIILCSAETSPDVAAPPRSTCAGTVASPQPTLPAILIVDDDRDVRLLLRFILEELGHTVLEAGDGCHGLRMLRSRGDHATIMLLDYHMPRMDGWALLRAIAEDEELAGRHAFALLTGDADALPAAFRDLLAARAIPILAKPLHLDDLLRVVEQCASRIGRNHPRPA